MLSSVGAFFSASSPSAASSSASTSSNFADFATDRDIWTGILDGSRVFELHVLKLSGSNWTAFGGRPRCRLMAKLDKVLGGQ